MKFAHIRAANISHLQSKYFTAKLFHLPEGHISLKKALAIASAFFWVAPTISNLLLLCAQKPMLPLSGPNQRQDHHRSLDLQAFGKKS